MHRTVTAVRVSGAETVSARLLSIYRCIKQLFKTINRPGLKLRPVCHGKCGGIRKPRFNMDYHYHHNGGAGFIACGQIKRRELALLQGSLGVVRTRHARPHPHPARPHEDGIRTPIPLVYSREPYPVPAHSRIITSCEDACRVNPSCVLRPCRPDNPCPPPLADGVVSAQLARRRSSSSRVCLHAVEEPPPVALWRALCRAPTCPDVERPLITLIGPSQWSHLDRSRRSPYTLA